MKHELKESRRRLRIARTRAKLMGSAERPRLAVRRTLKHVYGQVIDDAKGVTLASASDAMLTDAEKKGKTKTEVAFLVGKKLADSAKTKGVVTVIFDRRDRRYHGRVKAVAEGARDGGLTF